MVGQPLGHFAPSPDFPSTTMDRTNLPTREAGVIKASPRLDELERRYQREAFRGLSYEQALERFSSLWAEARQLNPDMGKDWLDDLEPDLAVARAVNGLPPAA